MSTILHLHRARHQKLFDESEIPSAEATRVLIAGTTRLIWIIGLIALLAFVCAAVA